MSSAAVASSPRNALCPCGSGKRYKHCHGALSEGAASPAGESSGRPAAAALREAVARLRADDPVAAEALCREVLAGDPDDPEALRILSRCEYGQGRVHEGLRCALRAVRSMRTRVLDPATQFLIWSDVNFLFTQALAGLDAAYANRKREEYASRATGSPGCDDAPLVSVVLVLPDHARSGSVGLRSVLAQDYRHLELVVVHAGGESDLKREFSSLLGDARFPVRRLTRPDASTSVLADAGVRAANGAFVNVLLASHEFSPTRIGALVRTIAARTGGWGFSNARFVDATGNTIAPDRDAAVRQWSERLAAIAEADTVGYTFIHQHFVAVDASNLFFRRTLYDDVGGFRDLKHTWAWDFCLRATMVEEPVYVASAEYLHHVTDLHPREQSRSAEIEAAQIAMFRDFYAIACREDSVPANGYAPCMAHWQMHFLKAAFHAGHVLAFALEELERLGTAVIERNVARHRAPPEPGLDFVGFAFGEFGLGENLRAFAKACQGDAIPFGVKDVDMRLKTRQADRSIAAHVVDELCHRCAVYCLNPDMMKPIRRLLVDGKASGRYNVGYWFWELERIPSEWGWALDDVDEVWVATEFIAEAMRRATAKPVVKIPTPIEVTTASSYTRAEFGLPEGRFLFLFSFDFNSFSKRKNPEATIAAFRRAFAPARRDVGLIIKSINGTNKPDKLREMRELIEGDERIVILDGFLTRDQVSGLQSVVDAYVSLHRAEGLGLGLAESMYLGKPVIATRYSGNLEFMNAANSCLVDYTLVPIAKGDYLYDDERFRWADPDVDHAARCMRRLVDDGQFRMRIAAQGRSDIRTRFTHARAASSVRQRLSALGLL